MGSGALQTVLDLGAGGRVSEVFNEEEGEIHGGTGSARGDDRPVHDDSRRGVEHETRDVQWFEKTGISRRPPAVQQALLRQHARRRADGCHLPSLGNLAAQQHRKTWILSQSPGALGPAGKNNQIK